MAIEVSEHVLDNPVWYSLTGPRRTAGEVRGNAARFDPDVGPFGALHDDGWDDLAALVGPGGITCVISPATVPDGWRTEFTIAGVQMVATTPFPPEPGDFEPLGPAHADEMLGFIEKTQPGPFGSRTVELGGFIGVREAGTLIAMAGERLRCAGYTEVSGVCTLAEHRGKGLGGALTRTVSNRIQARGEEAFLHASAKNTNAIRLYESLGFVVRRELEFVVVRAPE